MDKGGNKTIRFSKSINKIRIYSGRVKDEAILTFCLWIYNTEFKAQLWTSALLFHIYIYPNYSSIDLLIGRFLWILCLCTELNEALIMRYICQL